jgi:predicted enzyme related to lactoylglutathione lyase
MGKGIAREFAGAVIDVNDLELEAAFWGAMLGEEPGPIRSDGSWVTIGTLGGPAKLVLQKVPELKTIKDRIHIDFHVDDVDVAIARIVELGGSQLGDAKISGGVTMADPEGNEFCIGAFRRSKESVRTPL